MARIRKGDIVEILAGNDRGKRGRVLRVLADKDRVMVEGVNLRWKHLRKSQQNPQGGRVRREVAVHLSNVMLFDEASESRTRVGFRVEAGKKVRVSKRTGQKIGTAPAKKPAAKKKKKTPKKKKKASKAKAADEAKES